MSDKGSVFQKGGGGTNFEQAVQTAFLASLIIKGNAPLNFSNEIIEVAFQTTNRGWETDDLLIITKSAIGNHNLLAQIKNNISFTADNSLFQEVMSAFWKDYNNSKFDKEKDKLIIIKSGFTKDERNNLKSLLNWAKTHATEIDFITEVNRIKGKRNKLDVFKDVLKPLNNNTSLSDTEIWEFLKCLDVLEYDLTNQNSVDEIYFLNLIKLCKNEDTTSNEKEIWDVLSSFVSKLNKDGGSVTSDSVIKEEFYKHFNLHKLNPYFKSVEKLQSDSNIILAPLKNTIGGFHLNRKNISQSIVDTLNSHQLTIVTGKPGVGKSAAIKDFLKNELCDTRTFVFRADQFNESHLANVFSSQGVNETLIDIFSCVSLIPEKIIIIDSLEKLLEADPECAFKQFLSLLKQYPDIKVIGSSRTYAVDLITQKFGIEKDEIGIMEVLPLDKEELVIISENLPQLQGVLKNKKIETLLQSPKYLDFAILALNKSNENYSNISLTEFKEKLWNSLVVDSTNIKNGLPIKRENAFMEIAVNRAKEMKLFTKPINGDAEAIVLLENDEIIFQENQNRKYSPSHDILEDWALIKYVSEKYEEFSNPNELFGNLGNEPAIRRAFRLWVEDYLIEDNSKINELIKATISDSSIDKYWADEILIAVFKSNNCNSFYSAFEKELLNEEEQFQFLNRCIHLIRTACKESQASSKDNSILLPVGSGWTETLFFIRKHIGTLDKLKISICNFLYDWEYKFLFQNDIDEAETVAAKEIVLHYLKEIESGNEFWNEDVVKGKIKELLSILFNLAHVAKDELTELIKRALTINEDRGSWKLNSFYKKVIDNCLSGLGNQRFIKELPELVVETAWKEWKVKPLKPAPEGSITAMIGGNRYRDDECWGIRDKRSFFLSGVYKTPIYNLLCSHPFLGIKFITEFLNYSVDFYVKTDCDYKHKISKVDIELNDGTINSQLAAWELWAAYRGSSVTHYAIESILMSLEKYLLELASLKNDISTKNVQFIFNYLLKHSNNVATTSVLVSIAIAYPDISEKEMLPLLSVKEFYEWDMHRALKESTTLSPSDDRISFAQEERWKSNQLSHRKKFTRGLGDFIIDYQFNIRKLNKEIHLVFDKLKSKIEPDDIIWKKILTEIDIRNHKVGDYDDKLGGFPIKPEYDEEVTEFIESGQEQYKADTKSMNYSGLLLKVYEEKETMEFSIWEDCFNNYKSPNGKNLLYDRPVTLSFIGLRDFSKEISKEQRTWCIETIAETIVLILQDTFRRNFELNVRFNLMEKEIALTSFHLLFGNIEKAKDKKNLSILMLRVLYAPFGDHEVDKITEYIRTVFFKQFPAEAKIVWAALIMYAQFRKSNPYFYDDHDTKRLKTAYRKEEKFIDSIISKPDFSINLNDTDLKNYEGYILARAFIITPYYIEENIYSNFIKKFIPLLTEDLKIEEDYSYSQHKKNRQISSAYVLDCEFYLSELLLNANLELAKHVLDLVVSPVYAEDYKKRNSYRDEIFEFSSKIPKYLIYKLDDILANSNDESLNNKLINNFWEIWSYFFEKIRSSNQSYFISTLLLDIKWKSASVHWKALDGKKDVYYAMVKEFGKIKTQSIVNVLSTAGEKTMLPDGISWLVEIFKTDISSTTTLMSQSAERLIKRLFYNHISTIKANKRLIEDYLWILNKMVDYGSSTAYLFRENVITYKSIR